jgi:predicted TIM-barrel fold metal-dependent hydrolase
MRTITLEEHFVTTDFLNATKSSLSSSAMAAIREQLLDLGAGRIAAMDEGGVDLQVLSVAAVGLERIPAEDATKILADANDQLALAIKENPSRLAGFASLSLKSPESAAKEFERCIRTLGFKGALVNGTSGGAFLDDPRFTPLFEVAQALDVPIYLHPAPPPESVKQIYFSGLPGQSGDLLSMAGWGWHAETGMHCLRLILSGLFDRFPKLKIIIGHMGEDLPYSLSRVSGVLQSVSKHLEHGIADYFHKHFYVTTSGYFTQPPFLCALQVVGADRLLYSVDYPFSSNKVGQNFLSKLSVSPDDFAKISHRNAELLLKL